MSNNDINTGQLISYLDGELDAAAADNVQAAVAANPSLQQELEDLQLAKQAVTQYGISQQVRAIHGEMMQTLAKEQPAKARVKRMPAMLMRVAAAILILVGLFGVYQYIRVTPGNLYVEQYNAYNAPTMRGTDAGSAIKKAFNQKQYQTVIDLYKQNIAPAREEGFLAAQTYMQLNDFSNAATLFNSIIDSNKATQTAVLNDDAEYYLALCYLKTNKPAKALPILTKIHNDASHLYHNKVSNWYLFKLKILNWKQ